MKNKISKKEKFLMKIKRNFPAAVVGGAGTALIATEISGQPVLLIPAGIGAGAAIGLIHKFGKSTNKDKLKKVV